MGLRGELFSAKVIQQNRTYFFNVKENRMGDLYLNIVESKNRETGGFDRQSVILFADDLQAFLKGFDEALRILEKEMRARRQAGRSVIRGKTDESENNGERKRNRENTFIEGGRKRDFSEKPRKGAKKSAASRGVNSINRHSAASGNSRASERWREDFSPGGGRPPKGGKRVLVKKMRKGE